MKGWHRESGRHSLAARGIESNPESNIEFFNRIMKDEKERKAREKLKNDRKRRAIQIVKQIELHRNKTKRLMQELYELLYDNYLFTYEERQRFQEKYNIDKLLRDKQ